MAERGKKREAILAAAERLLKEKRTHELTMEAVAEEAKVGKGTIYNHFANKDELLFQLATSGFEALCELVRAAPTEGAFTPRLTELAGHIATFFLERRATLRMIQEHEGRVGGFDGGTKKRWLEHRERLVLALSEMLAGGVRSGEIRADLPSELMANLFLGLMRTRGRDYAHKPKERPPVAQIVQFFLTGARAPGAQGDPS